MEDGKETEELKQFMELIPDEEVAINAIALAVKSPNIVDWKIYKKERKSYYQIIRAGGKSQMYMVFSQMLKCFNREDLEDLYMLVKAKYKSARPVEDLDLLLWGDLKSMFEQHQKMEDGKETEELKQFMELIPDEKVAINAIALAVKSPNIVDCKIYKKERKSYYQIIRADEKSQMYMVFSQMLKSFNREDLEDLYMLVKAKYESARPVEDLDLLLWGDLKSMFEPHIYMLVEKKYPLTPPTLLMMLEKKQQIDCESKIAYQLLKFIKK
nr:hypothetical protein [Tanacetum cinerariifolium]